MKIVSDRKTVRQEFSLWQNAMLDGATALGTHKWKIADAELYLRLENPRHVTKPVLNASLTKSPLFDSAAVKINFPARPDTPNGLAGIGISNDGRSWLLRQGHLQKNAVSDAIRGFEFPLLAHREPDLVSQPETDNRVTRYWFRVCRLDASPTLIRQETAKFVELCFLVRCRKAAGEETGDTSYSVTEGALRLLVRFARERSKSLIAKKKQSVLKVGGELRCEACSFKFSEKYGPRGEGFIEVHHNAKPLHLYAGPEDTDIADLALICANCHRIAHRTADWLTVVEIRKLLANGRG